VVLSAVEHAEDGNRLRVLVHGIGDHGAPFVVGEPKARTDVFTCRTTEWEQRQSLARRDHRACVAFIDRRRRTLGDVQERRLQWLAGLRRKDDAVRHQALAEVLLCAAASRAFTAPTPTAREGSATRAS